MAESPRGDQDTDAHAQFINELLSHDTRSHMSFVYLMRIAWRAGFYLTSLGLAVWLVPNLYTGRYFAQISHFLPTTFLLLLIAGLVYILAFRLQDTAFSNLNLALGAVGFMLLACEVGIRVWDRYDPIFRPSHLEDDIPYGPSEFSPYRPGGTGFTHGNPVHINSLGFRGPEYLLAKPAGTFRIIAIGDSYTFGQGVGEEDRYTNVLEHGLHERYPEKSIEVTNLGVMGWSAIDEMKLLERLGPQLNPDLVLIGFTVNDVYEGNTVLDQEMMNRWKVPLPERVKTSLISSSTFLRWITLRYNKFLMYLGIRLDIIAFLEAMYASNSEEWERFEAAYQGMQDWTRKHRTPPLLVGVFVTPIYRDPGNNDFIKMNPKMQLQRNYLRQVETTLNGMGILTVNSLQLFQNHNKQQLAVSKWEGHPNPLAHRLYAEGLLNAIVHHNLIH